MLEENLIEGKVYRRDTNFLARISWEGKSLRYLSYLYIPNNEFTKAEQKGMPNLSMKDANLREATFEELQWFEYCEQQQQYISFTDYQTLIVPTLNSIQLYPLC